MIIRRAGHDFSHAAFFDFSIDHCGRGVTRQYDRSSYDESGAREDAISGQGWNILMIWWGGGSHHSPRPRWWYQSPLEDIVGNFPHLANDHLNNGEWSVVRSCHVMALYVMVGDGVLVLAAAWKWQEVCHTHPSSLSTTLLQYLRLNLAHSHVRVSCFHTLLVGPLNSRACDRRMMMLIYVQSGYDHEMWSATLRSFFICDHLRCIAINLITMITNNDRNDCKVIVRSTCDQICNQTVAINCPSPSDVQMLILAKTLSHFIFHRVSPWRPPW